MADSTVSLFTPYPFEKGQKIRITEGPRSGDWLVIGVTDKKVALRCPVSLREFEWDRFCFHVADKKRPWPQTDE